MTRRAPFVAFLAFLVLASASAAAQAAGPALFHGPRPSPFDTITLPPAWSGIWSYSDTTYACGNPTPTYSSSGLDTLCAGQDVLGGSGSTYNCTGSFTDTDGNVTCTAVDTAFTGCSYTVTINIVATRSGDTYTSTTTTTTTWSPASCAGVANSCYVTNSHGTRTGPQPPNCGTPVVPLTWGRIKLLER
jgi:hypothetical protein